MGRRKNNKVWDHFEKTDKGKWKCKNCKGEYAANTSATRLKDHIDQREGRGIEVCKFDSHKSNSDYEIQHNVLISQGQIQADDDVEDQEMIPIGPSIVSYGENKDFQMMKQYVFDCLRPEDKVFISSLSYLNQEEFITLKPEAHLDSLVIDAFVEILTDIERNKNTTPSKWYLPVTFSDAALKGKLGHFMNFVHRQKMKENYMSDLKSCEKIFIPVHVEPRPNEGHFYLYIIHLKNKEIEMWDSWPNKYVAESDDETAKKLLLVMEKLFEEVAFTQFCSKIANEGLLQPNGFDCGVFVINYMQESENYVKKIPSFEFDSKKEREDLALKLLNNDLNQEKQNLYDKARRHYAQVEKQESNKRLRVDPSKQYSEDSVKRNDCLEKDLIGRKFRSYTEKIRRLIKDDKVSTIGVWGIGGSGKTVLADHMYNKLLEEGDTKVIWVTVSQNSISHLQKVIAQSIELDISGELEFKVIATKLRQAFKVMKKCIIILDDVWDYFFLKEVGFPISDNWVKLVLTTRIWDVCQGMDCEKYTIEVEPIDREDSCALFEKAIGSFYEGLSLEVKLIARLVTYECEGLPLAIFRIAESMKGKKHVREWNYMLECLENLEYGQYEIVKWVLPVLRSSYDFLTTKLQRLFLYCALTCENSYGSITSDNLMRIFVYEGVDAKKKLSVQYDEVHNMLDRLKNHRMLEELSEGELTVNKFLRLLAICIVEDTDKIIANVNKGLKEIPSDYQWREDLQKVFLSRNDIQTIPDGICLRGSQLSTLLLDRNLNLNYISDDFFNSIPALKVLDLSHTRIEHLPESVSNLKCLNALLLSWCGALSYIPSLSKLKLLVSLDLCGTAITAVPMGLESCVNLRQLDVLHTYMLLPSLLISKLVNLEFLFGPLLTETYIQGLDELKVIVAFFQDISSFHTYMDKITRLNTSFYLVLQDEVMPRYGDELDVYNRYYSRSIQRITFDGIDLGNIKGELLSDTKELIIRDCQVAGTGTVGSPLCSIVSSLDELEIELLNIEGFEAMEYLLCFSSNCLFCSSCQLVGRVELLFLDGLKYIVSPHANPSFQIQSRLFSHLTVLKIEYCNNMETLIAPKLLKILENLQTIVVYRCEEMKEIFVGDDDCDRMMEYTPSDNSLIDIVNGSISQPTHITLPKLTSLRLWNLPGLDFVCRSLLLFPSLQTFSASQCPKLIHARIQISDGCELLPIEKTALGYFWHVKTD